MGFYEQIAPYYEYIFPAGQEQLDFIKKAAGNPPKKLLDAACGTGEYSISLAGCGYEVWAFDLDAEMVRRAEIKAKEKNVNVRLFVADMLILDEMPGTGFDCVFCIGNSIVHLGSKDAILDAIRNMKKKLGRNGALLLQIINFDRILEKGVTSLPTITNSDIGLVFHRNYKRNEETGIIYFDTELIIKNDNCDERFENRVELFPLLSADMRELLQLAGFDSIKFYGGFSGEPYIAGESYLLVAEAM